MTASAPINVAVLTAAAMVAFAANSVITRLALEPGLIDAASFQALRVASAAAVLLAALLARGDRFELNRRAGLGAAALMGYAAPFTIAYVTLGAGAGALILFGVVQLTMFAVALRRGERFGPVALIGLSLALIGLVYLLLPGAAAPDPMGAALMVVAGVAWALYSLLGQKAGAPLPATASNFLLAAPIAVVIWLVGAGLTEVTLTAQGAGLALLSGAAASALGYIIWYAALPQLTAGAAATVQLSVPIIAALGGALLLAEPFTARLALASALTLGGVALALSARATPKKEPS